MDTKPEVHREIVRRLRAMTPAERIRVTLERIALGFAIHETALKKLGMENKDWTPKRR
jgi:hypothetical protein